MTRIILAALAFLLSAPSAWAESCADHLKEIDAIGSMKELSGASAKIVEEGRAKAIDLQKAGKDDACIQALNAVRIAYGSKAVLDSTPPKND
jgi:hypothetical protein